MKHIQGIESPVFSKSLGDIISKINQFENLHKLGKSFTISYILSTYSSLGDFSEKSNLAFSTPANLPRLLVHHR